MRFIATYYATLATSNENRQHKKIKIGIFQGFSTRIFFFNQKN